MLRRALELQQRRLGRQLRSMRHARGWTQEEAAERMHIHTVSLARLESGSENVTLATLVAAASAFGITVARLFASKTKPVITRRARITTT